MTDRFARVGGRLWLVCLAGSLVLAGCSSSRLAAPIYNRTNASSASRPAEPVTPPAVVTAPAEAPASSAPVENGVQAAPIRGSGGGIEVRPLESRPLDAPPATAPGTSSAVTPGAMPGAPAARVWPKLLKRPYSDLALSEMQAADALPKTMPPATPTAPPATGTAGAKPGTVPPPPSVATAPSTSVPAAPAAPLVTAPPPPPPTSATGFAWPARGIVATPFADPRSLGIVIDGNLGDPVSAAGDGRVIFSGPGPRGYGNLIIIKHDDDTVSVYGHNRSLLVKEGQSVKRGQKVAELGESTDKPNLLFEIRKQGKPVDPLLYLPKR